MEVETAMERVSLANPSTTQQAIERLMHGGHFLQAARLARQARDAATNSQDRRRHLKSLLFANSQLAVAQQVASKFRRRRRPVQQLHEILTRLQHEGVDISVEDEENPANGMIYLAVDSTTLIALFKDMPPHGRPPAKVRCQPLTTVQLKVFDTLKGYVQEHGYPPSTRELARLVGIASCSTAHKHLTALEEKGYILREPGCPRALTILA